MENIEDNYLANQLKSERNINIALLSHNAYWSEIMRLNSHFKNCNVVVTGGSTAYINNKGIKEFQNSDLIIFHSSKYYAEREINYLKKIAIEISKNKFKRVTIGYLYFIPVEQLKNQNSSEQIKIISFKDEKEIIKEVTLEDSITTYDLIEFTLYTADSFENNKQYLLEKKL